MDAPRDRRLHRGPTAEDARIVQLLEEGDPERIELEETLDAVAAARWLRSALEEAQAAEAADYLAALCCFALAAGARCIGELRSGLLDDEAAPPNLVALAVELRPRGGAWDGAARLAAWGYLAQVAHQNFPGEYAEAIERAVAAMPLRPPTVEQVIQIGPLSTQAPENFHLRLVRLIVREARGPDDLHAAIELVEARWPPAWRRGWEVFRELHEGHFPPRE